MTDDPQDPTPTPGRHVVYVDGCGSTDRFGAVILAADPARHRVDLRVAHAGGIVQYGARWWTGRHEPIIAKVGVNLAWPVGLPRQYGMPVRLETWAGDLPDLAAADR